MYTRIVRSTLFWVPLIVFIGSLGVPPAAAAQSPPSKPQEQHQHATPTAERPQGEQHMPMTREGSGTAWLPDASPMYAVHRQRGAWQLMIHGNGFLQYLDDGGDRGIDQVGSINWIMGMADRSVGQGHLGLRTMFSVEPATIGGCGYPDLLATGEQCKGEPIHDRQHQHDLFMEVAALYDRPLRGGLRWQVYGGPAGEPALGPVAYPHRVSAMPNLLAPITHHWLDATHITFGVVTAGVYGTRWKTEASAFNGREPDEQRTGFDLAPLDSLSGRVWYLPTNNLALQFSAGRLNEAEPGEDGGPRVDVTRVTASATYHRIRGENGVWASTVAWGRNAESGQATHAVLVESNLTLRDQDSWFGRLEVVGKTAHDLDVPRSLVHDVEGEQVFTVSKLQVGYTRYFNAWRDLKPGIGLTASLGFVPRGLEAFYGDRVTPGVGIFLTIRPAAMRMMMTTPSAPATTAPGAPTHEHGAPNTGAAAPAAPTAHEHPAPKPAAPAPAKPSTERKPESGATPTPAPAGEPKLPVLPAERVIDPACAKTIDLTKAPRGTYQGKVYYFCSESDRDEFLKDPAAYLKKRGWS